MSYFSLWAFPSCEEEEEEDGNVQSRSQKEGQGTETAGEGMSIYLLTPLCQSNKSKKCEQMNA